MTDADLETWFAEQKAEIPKCEKVGNVANLRNFILPQLKDYPAKEREFIDLCDARTKSIMEAPRK